MKKTFIFFSLLLFTLATHAQKEKLKGSRIVITAQKDIGEYENIEIEDNIELFLSKGDNAELEIEADDNLHDAISINLSGGTLRISLSQPVTGAKKLSVKVTFTNNLKMIISKGDSRVTALTDLTLDDLTFKAFGNSKIYANVKSGSFTLMANDKSHSELNVTADIVAVELSNNARIKALISTPKMKFDMYQKSSANIEGDAIDLKLRIDNNSTFNATNLVAKTAEMIVEGFGNASLTVAGAVTIEASGKADIELFGDQQIEIRKFTDNASLRKKPVK
ncbi:MAG TPA: DUF2807 domain-containing protein [Flavobacterium sp.]